MSVDHTKAAISPTLVLRRVVSVSLSLTGIETPPRNRCASLSTITSFSVGNTCLGDMGSSCGTQRPIRPTSYDAASMSEERSHWAKDDSPPKPRHWTTEWKAGDFCVFQTRLPFQTREEWIDDDGPYHIPPVCIIVDISPSMLLFKHITPVVFSNVPYDTHLFPDRLAYHQVKAEALLEFGRGRMKLRRLRRPSQAEMISSQVPRVKGTACEVWSQQGDNKVDHYQYQWVPAMIVLVEKASPQLESGSKLDNHKLYVKPTLSMTETTTYCLPLNSVLVAPDQFYNKPRHEGEPML